MNQSDQLNALVVGSDSQIGSVLKTRLQQSGASVIGTTRKLTNVDQSTRYLDLEDLQMDQLGQGFDCAIICAAMTNIAQCDQDPVRSRKINVINTLRLIDFLVGQECFVVYLSSNAVFDGSLPFRTPADIPCPTTLYGRFKQEVEQHIISHFPRQACVLRLTKVISDDMPLLSEWRTKVGNGEKIRTFTNKLISPISVSEVAEAITLLMHQRAGGIHQLGGREELSFTQFARQIFKDKPSALALISAETDPSIQHIQYNSLMTHLPDYASAKASYSFEGSDLIVGSLLRNVSQGCYIDIGANHPVVQNNTYHFYRSGWRGLAVDGNDEFGALWGQIRADDIFVTGLISDAIKDVEFAIYPEKTISSIDAAAIARYSSRYRPEDVIVEKRTTTTLFDLKKTYLPDDEIHLLSVDIEGEDLNCLVGARLDQWQPGVIVIETKNMSLYDTTSNEVVRYLTSLGYRLIAKTPLDAFFVFPQKHYLQWIPASIL